MRLFTSALFFLTIFVSAPGLAQPKDSPNSSAYVELSDGKDRQLEAHGTKTDKDKKKNSKVSIDVLEKHVLELINKDRLQAGTSQLPVNAKLSNLARAYAEKMKKDQFFAHVDKQGLGAQERAKAAGINCGVYENLGWQSGDESDLEKIDALDQSFMSEPPNEKNHRFIILKSEHTNVGIGIARTKDEVWEVQEYTDTEP